MALPAHLELEHGSHHPSAQIEVAPCQQLLRFCCLSSRAGAPFACAGADPPLLQGLLLSILLLVAHTGIRCCAVYPQARSNAPVSRDVVGDSPSPSLSSRLSMFCTFNQSMVSLLPNTGPIFLPGCKLDLQCCNSYEYCVSCCLNPSKIKKEDVLKLKEAKPVTAGTYTNVFDFCMGRCRHSSASVVHWYWFFFPLRVPANKRRMLHAYCHWRSTE
ncbi:hypothetical protein BDA96_02G441100 [Sorghum bicolor]|uniref:SREBP regulating gene protein n=2 Tax=Sorghum bicolor TaxID=4558 RepID=A0A1B6QGB8_SORBI|nr:uncharacterized protein LOC8078576 [Sorghum bicolor]XP_021310044.1 uncharacterized protein LOC8078576 [Sorghum bicolor]KAG0546362.1 hypothetical protein BDA96_02G441100 [Sorghum bicolor]KXG36965.1 hypothetical protein SORBI_3002G421000 [Sorghum bicolor]KXG36966.1 hypothetical protein SORBI_3002G421000 [Sorghum bicolor]|eukprot:XP_021310043.1 uncharacterized protein LOC8078576 [Sorghum bicolor]